jgi:hypothetical protein
MANEETEEQAEEQSEDQAEKTEAEEKPSKAEEPDVRKMIDEMRAEVRGQVGVAAQAAGEARQYVGALLQKIQDVATKRQQAESPSRQDMFDENPEAAVNQMFNERVAPIVGEYLTNTARMHRNQAADKLGENWQRYEREIDDFMATMPLDVQAKPGAWESAYRYILAGHLDEELERREKSKRERASQAEGVGGQRRPAREAPIEPIERELMKAFGLNEKEWREYSSDDIERTPPSRDRRSVFAGRNRDDGR